MIGGRSKATELYWQVASAVRGHREMTVGDAFARLNVAESLLYSLHPPPYGFIRRLNELRDHLIIGRAAHGKAAV